MAYLDNPDGHSHKTVEERLQYLEQQMHLSRNSPVFRAVSDLEDQVETIHEQVAEVRTEVRSLISWLPFLNQVWNWFRNW
jgi:hypothetical protein